MTTCFRAAFLKDLEQINEPIGSNNYVRQIKVESLVDWRWHGSVQIRRSETLSEVEKSAQTSA